MDDSVLVSSLRAVTKLGTEVVAFVQLVPGDSAAGSDRQFVGPTNDELQRKGDK
ncbi:hypothetical protein TWF694_009919 [Orbilia ellipsospora]|uniref:Uncharacterized protein n=1 Tax=Orbilia ellipsospora TaxID=2528407 RepID=A0AAV9XIQ8_9PEZI